MTSSSADTPTPRDQALDLILAALGEPEGREGDTAPPVEVPNVSYGPVLRRLRDAQVASVYATLALIEEVGRLRGAVDEVAEAVREVGRAAGEPARQRGSTSPSSRQPRGGGAT
jgi:hypothetical protein